jgi:hypothetical protein
MLIVRLLCVIRMNCVCTLISRTSSVKRAMLASSDLSFSKQNETQQSAAGRVSIASRTAANLKVG